MIQAAFAKDVKKNLSSSSFSFTFIDPKYHNYFPVLRSWNLSSQFTGMAGGKVIVLLHTL